MALYQDQITRLIDEDDESLRIRVKQNQLRRASFHKLKYFLWKLKIKSAKSQGIQTISFQGMTIRKPGAYANVKTI